MQMRHHPRQAAPQRRPIQGERRRRPGRRREEEHAEPGPRPVKSFAYCTPPVYFTSGSPYKRTGAACEWLHRPRRAEPFGRDHSRFLHRAAARERGRQLFSGGPRRQPGHLSHGQSGHSHALRCTPCVILPTKQTGRGENDSSPPVASPP